MTENEMQYDDDAQCLAQGLLDYWFEGCEPMHGFENHLITVLQIAYQRGYGDGIDCARNAGT